MKERVEDVGRLREKLDRILDSELFESASMNDEAFIEKFKDEEELDTLRLQLQFLKDNLWDCYEIAKGDDEE
jgi:hypothetical protein